MNARRRSTGRILALTVGLSLFCSGAEADGVPPVTLRLKEQESNRFLAEWRVPRQIPARAIPSPVLPESCRNVGERAVTERPGAWFVRQTFVCADGLEGQLVGIEFPILNATVSTVVRVELLSGDRYAHILAPLEESWRLPDSALGGARAWFRAAGQAVLDGTDHFVSHGVHVAFALALVLLGGLAVSIRLATFFAVGQLFAVALFSAAGIQLGAPIAEIGVAVAVALLAREALRPPAERRQLAALAGAAGLVHGLGLAHLVSPPAGTDGSGIVFYGLVVLGMDAALLLSTMVGSALRGLVPRRLSLRPLATLAIYGVGVGAVALALGLPATDSAAAARETTAGMQLPNLPIPAGAAATAASRRIATPFPDAALQSFVSVAPFEVRHEVLVRLRDFAEQSGVDPSGEVAIAVQDAVKGRIRELVAGRTGITIDANEIGPADVRVDFLTLGARGALPRLVPVPEPVESAWLGVTTVYLTQSTSREVLLTWNGLDGEAPLPATVTDPESSRSVELTGRQPTLLWKNELTEDPTPIVQAVAVELPVLWLPVLSVVLLAAAMVLIVAALRGRVKERSIAFARIVLAGAIVLAPAVNVAVPLPLAVDETPDREGTKRILARLLPNVYRAFEFPTESAAYDRLALSVTGDTLTEIYLEHRRAVTMEERGGARARVEAVEVLDVEAVEPGSRGGFVADAVWTVGGTVTHFGHRHFRQNRYDARVAVVPVDGHWKIRSIEVFDEERLR